MKFNFFLAKNYQRDSSENTARICEFPEFTSFFHPQKGGTQAYCCTAGVTAFSCTQKPSFRSYAKAGVANRNQSVSGVDFLQIFVAVLIAPVQQLLSSRSATQKLVR